MFQRKESRCQQDQPKEVKGLPLEGGTRVRGCGEVLFYVTHHVDKFGVLKYVHV